MNSQHMGRTLWLALALQGLLGLKFMQQAVDRKRKQAQEEFDQMVAGIEVSFSFIRCTRIHLICSDEWLE
jgi:hypothetical protein